MKTVVLIGLEVVKLGDMDDAAPHRMTVDAYVDGKILRYQVTGHYNGWPTGPPERTLDELARVQVNFSRRNEIAAELDRLDRRYAEKAAPFAKELFREQVRVLYGDGGVAFLDEEKPS